MEDLKTYLIEQIDGQNDDYAKMHKRFLKDIKAFEKSKIIWVGRIDEVYGDSMIAFGNSEKEVENLLFKEYKAIGKELNEGGFGYNNNGSKTKAEFFEWFCVWVQPMAIGKCYSGDSDESRNLKKQKK